VSRIERLLLTGVLAVYTLWVRRFWFVTDDAFITFRYARNLARGLGPRFNLGVDPPVEGYSNFLWMLLCAGVEAAGLDVTAWPCLISVILGGVLVWRVFRYLLTSGLAAPMAAGGALMCALYTPFAVHATSGLATMPLALALFLCFEALIAPGPIRPWRAGLALVALALIRVEGIAWAAAVLALAVLIRREAADRRALLASVLGLGAVYGAYFTWRSGYYGLPFANTVYAKAAFSPARLSRGFDYVAVQLLTGLTPLLTLPAAARLLRGPGKALTLAITALALAPWAYAALVGGDFMTMGRFLVPGWAFSALLITQALAGWTAGTRPALRRAVTAGVIGLGVLSGFDIHPAPAALRAQLHYRLNRPVEKFRSEYAQWNYQRQNGRRWAALGRAMGYWLAPESRVVAGAIGAPGYYSDLFFYDANGLVTPEVLRQPPPPDAALRSPGHDREVSADFFLPEAPEVLRANLVRGPDCEAGAIDAFLQLTEDDWLAPLRLEGRERYILELRPLPPGDPWGSDTVLLYWERLADDADADAARAASERSLSAPCETLKRWSTHG